MNIAIILSNAVSISKLSKKGTEIFDYILINNLVKLGKGHDFTAFASGDSDLPVKIISIDQQASIADESIIKKNKHIIFELALISKAFAMQDQFDLYHINIGDGDIVLPFAPFVKKPILITLHYTQAISYIKKYFSQFNDLEHVFFISISNAQRKFFPNLNYAGTIYHGIETGDFGFDGIGGQSIIWAGRGVPDKGLDVVLEVVSRVKKGAKLFCIRKEESAAWLNKLLASYQNPISSKKVLLEFDKNRSDLIPHYQKSRLFLAPLQWEEPFGLVLIESMACGTPIVAYGRGSVPEIVQDGKHGFIVNFSDADVRGDWVVKKTGIEGLCEAIDRIYAMPDQEYRQMRQTCREHVEANFSAMRMAMDYNTVYGSVASKSYYPRKNAGG